MASLFRKGKKGTKDSAEIVLHQQEKLAVKGPEKKQPVPEDGDVLFYLKYLGFTLVDEVSGDDSYANGASEKAVQRILKMERQKQQKIELWVTKDGINVKDRKTLEELLDVSIFRISFCTVSKIHIKVFAFIARNTVNETMECHAFLCDTKKHAEQVALTAWQLFSKTSEEEKESGPLFSNSTTTFSTSEKQHSQPDTSQFSLQSTKQCTSDKKIFSLHPPPSNPFRESSTNGRRSRTPPSNGMNGAHNTSTDSATGSDEENQEVEDFFSQLAETRSRDQIPSFSTNFVDVNNSVWPNMGGQDFFGELPSQPSVDDLLGL